MTDQFARWRHAIETGSRVEWERGDVASGFYKRDAGRGASKPIEAIAIYRDDAGALQCIRDVYGDGSRMDADQIEELFASCGLYPIPEDVYRAVTERGEAWPPEYGTRLTMKEMKAGIAWTPKLGRKKLGPGDQADNPRAVIGDNRPPEEIHRDGEAAGHTVDGEQLPDRVALAEISALASRVKVYLADIGGAPRDKVEADAIGDYAVKFKALSTKAEDARKAAKEPHLAAGREVDARWRAPKDLADVSRRRCLEIAQAYMDAENAHRVEVAEQTGGEAAVVTSVGNGRQVSTRSTTVWIVTDPKAYLLFLLSQYGELPSDLIELAGKIAQRRAQEAPGVEQTRERKAA